MANGGLNPTYVSVIFPMALPKPYTYEVPFELRDQIIFGGRVEVPLKNKLYSALVIDIISSIDPNSYKPRKVISIIDESPLISKDILKFWVWIAAYYNCSLGQVMNVAMPAGLKLGSETIISLNPFFEEDFNNLSDNEYLIAEAVSIRKELTIGEVKNILNKGSVYREVKSLIERGTIWVKEELIDTFKPRKSTLIGFTEYYEEDRERLSEALEMTKRSEKQTKGILTLIEMSDPYQWVPKKKLYQKAGIDNGPVQALVKKEIFRIKERVVSRIDNPDYEIKLKPLSPLSPIQKNAVDEISKIWEINHCLLLHGVTGSGKTRVYMELIKAAIEEGKQVLYLLPEIALTTQIVERLMSVFGKNVMVYHSRMNNQERVEMWKATRIGKPIVIGARSSLFLPFDKLGLVIVDEEHDPSYKQQDPAPRYNARDAAVFMAKNWGAKVILGSATPSLETYLNAQKSKYGKVEMMERFGNVALPEIKVVDLRSARKLKRMTGFFSKTLVDDIDAALVADKQIILFQNRRGFAPIIQCSSCGWKGECPNCDVTLTKHKFYDQLRCHYCGYQHPLPKICPSCSDDALYEMGFGTEKIEVEIATLFPMARVGRLDYDTTRSKSSYERIINDFQEKRLDILVGTQMVTKGLDFDNIAVVGVLNADLLLFFPDFRASERAFQLLTQVAGRAGRREEQGKVIIQTSQPNHPVIVDTVNYNYHKFIVREAFERKEFRYPPYFRMINLILKHKDIKVVDHASELLASRLKEIMTTRVTGPAEPGIARIRNQYIRTITIRLEKNPTVVSKAKEIIHRNIQKLKQQDGLKSVRINVDVDPY